jgi:hypothetical protein
MQARRRRSAERCAPSSAFHHFSANQQVAPEPKLRPLTVSTSNAEGSREFKSPSLRHTVWHASLHYGEAMKSARGARFTRGRGRGECQRQRLSVKIA